MRGTMPVKIARVITNLVLNPQYIPRCVTHNLINGRTPLDLQVPWFSYAAIDFLEEFARPEMKVYEYGTGGSTLFFAQRTESVFSIENDPTWYQFVSARLVEKSIENVIMQLHPFDFKNPEGFENSAYLNAIPDEPFDIIVVDGSEEWKKIRPICFQKAETRVKEGGIIVVDDSWRYPTLRNEHHARRCRTFQSVGPCRPGVTSTDVFFY
jgi:predicted O-methyltransferase YrrM